MGTQLLKNDADRKIPKYSNKKTCPNANFPTTNPTYTDLGLRPGLGFERPPTKHLFCDKALLKLGP